MASGKTIVIGAVLSHNGTFRANEITEETGLSRGLVFKHLNKLAETGLLEKSGPIYIVVDKARLLNALIETTDSVDGKRMSYVPMLIHNNSVDLFRRLATNVLRARALDLPDSIDMKVALIQVLDEIVMSMRNEKKWITNSSITPKSAANKIFKEDIDMGELWDAMAQLTKLSTSRAEYVQLVEEAVTETRNPTEESEE